jgi:hypothetical protein
MILEISEPPLAVRCPSLVVGRSSLAVLHKGG